METFNVVDNITSLGLTVTVTASDDCYRRPAGDGETLESLSVTVTVTVTDRVTVTVTSDDGYRRRLEMEETLESLSVTVTVTDRVTVTASDDGYRRRLEMEETLESLSVTVTDCVTGTVTASDDGYRRRLGMEETLSVTVTVTASDDGYRRRLEMEETLESLSAALAAAYRDCRRRHYSAACRPALGEVLVAPWQRGWHRGLVTDLSERLPAAPAHSGGQILTAGPTLAPGGEGRVGEDGGDDV